MVLQHFYLHACTGEGFIYLAKKMKMKNTLPVMTVSMRGQLVWGPDVALGQVGKVFGQFLICQG